MTERADAHIHLFEHGFSDAFTNRSGVSIDEVACYESLRQSYNIDQALVVGFSGDPRGAHNNAFLAEVVKTRDWVRPTAHIVLGEPLTAERLEDLRTKHFVGISLYVFSAADMAAVGATSDDVWRWLAEHRWLVSVNSRGDCWSVWTPIVERHRELRLVVSHLGLPPQVALPPDGETAKEAMATMLALAASDQVRVKLSGFYAISDPGYDYPHEAAWPYVQALISAFGCSRLLWASDFSPHLDMLSFPQTFGLFAKMPFLSDEDRRHIEGENLMGLLQQVITGAC